MKVSELQGAALDWAVANCEGHDAHYYKGVVRTTMQQHFGPECKYSTDWAQGGPIIEREGITVSRTDQKSEKGLWVAYRIERLFEDEYEHEYQHGPSPLIAAMRCYIASQLGDEVELPAGLI